MNASWILRTAFAVLPLFCGSAVLTACGGGKAVSSLEEEQVFTLEYGNFEDQLNLFTLTMVDTVDTSLVMRDGFFYIANGEAKKIMEMNSYGDLITFYYNEDANPSPSYGRDAEAKIATRKAIPYEFNELSHIAVDARKYLYAVDKLPLERQEQDDGGHQVLSQIVLRFDDDGRFLNYLGQQGPGGTPFPFIKDMYATNTNELVVVCFDADAYIVYWFSVDGYLLYKIPVTKRNVPNPYREEKKQDAWPQITAIVPDYVNRTLYLKVDYYSSYVDEASRLQSGITYNKSFVYPLRVEDGTYGEALEVLPYTEQSAQGFSNERLESPYDFLGVTDSGWFFFMISTEEGFAIQMVQADGQRILRRRLPLDRKDNLYYTFDLSNSGILSALLVKSDRAVIDWWRTDSLIQSVAKS